MNTLPNKASELIRLAVADCLKIETMSNYKFDMEYWLCKSIDQNICTVCMAGAVMACTLKEYNKRFGEYGALCPFQYEDEINDKLRFINIVREGDINHFPLKELEACSAEQLAKINKFIIDDFKPNLGRADWDTYLKAADMLEELGQ